jgi:hypothetical protein
MTTELTIALERYDRHIPFFMNMVEAPAGLTLKALEVGMAPPPGATGSREGVGAA